MNNKIFMLEVVKFDSDKKFGFGKIIFNPYGKKYDLGKEIMFRMKNHADEIIYFGGCCFMVGNTPYSEEISPMKIGLIMCAHIKIGCKGPVVKRWLEVNEYSVLKAVCNYKEKEFRKDHEQKNRNKEYTHSSQQQKKDTCWDILGLIKTETSIHDLKKRYRELVKKHHPDKGGNNAKMSEINSAYQEAMSILLH